MEEMYVVSSWLMKNYYVKDLHRLFMNRSTVHEEVELNDLKKHNKGELILCLFLKVPTGPRWTERQRRRASENI